MKQFGTVLLILLLAMIFLLILKPTTVRADGFSLYCLYVPNLQRIQAECDHFGDWMQGGCRQTLAMNSPNWSSRDYPRSGPALGLDGSCNVASSESERGCVRLRNETSTVIAIKQLVVPASDVNHLNIPDLFAVPPDSMASGWWNGDWNCDQTVSGLPVPVEGAFAVPAEGWTGAVPDFELLAFSSWNFADDPNWTTAYEAVRDGYIGLLGEGGERNTAAHGTLENVIRGWKARWSVFDEMAHMGSGNAIAGRSISEYYLQRYGYLNESRLEELGLWTGSEHFELEQAIDWIFVNTTECGVQCDPNVMFGDIDVSVRPVTHGHVKLLGKKLLAEQRSRHR
jgi:hypothetical protein